MCVFYLYPILDSQQCVKRDSCRRLILSRLLCLFYFYFYFYFYFWYFLCICYMLRGLGPIPNLGPISPNSDLFSHSPAEAVPIQVPNAVDCGPAGVLTPDTCPGLVLDDTRMPTFTTRSPSNIAVINRLQTSLAETGPSRSQPMITTIHLFCAYSFHAAGFGHGDFGHTIWTRPK